MTRHELYKAMEQEKIIMYDTFFARLERTPLPELVTRWIGILILDREYRGPDRRQSRTCPAGIGTAKGN